MRQSKTLPVLRPRSTSFARSFSSRKPGVATVEELDEFLAQFGAENVVVVDARNPVFQVEPGDAKSDAVAPVSGTGTNELRPRTVNLVYDRETRGVSLADKELHSVSN